MEGREHPGARRWAWSSELCWSRQQGSRAAGGWGVRDVGTAREGRARQGASPVWRPGELQEESPR